ncbi:MAG TPA: CcdB family protein [Acetobacteraceae bacterium]|nr:CcdB family protein [Acetobacteraceae bacterium]
MARLDVYRSPGRSGQGYVVDVQADLLSGLATRVVVPLLPAGSLQAAARDLNPVFDIAGQPHVLVTQAIATVPRRELKQPIASLLHRHDVILRALDILLSGL